MIKELSIMTDRQTQAVAEVIHASFTGCPDLWGEVSHDAWIEYAKEAIDASDAKYVPILYQALLDIVQSDECHEEWYRTIAREALSKLHLGGGE